MFEKVRILCLIVCVLLLLSACFPGVSSHVNELAICGSYGVPGMFCSDLKGETCSYRVLEEDAQGRILFEYITNSVIGDQEETAYVICQKYDSESVYYYEDLCYRLASAQEQELNSLKQQNDWDLPLDEEKMSRRPNALSLDLVIMTDSALDREKIRSAVCESMGIEQDGIEELCMLDIDPAGRELLWLETGTGGHTQTYFVIVNLSYAVEYLKVDAAAWNQEDLAAFKSGSGWKYGG